MKKVLVDVHSRGVDVYSGDESKISLLLHKEIFFKENSHVERGLHFNDEEALVRLMERLAANYFDCKIEAYAREIFKMLPKNYFDELQAEIYKRSKINLMLADEEHDSFS